MNVQAVNCVCCKAPSRLPADEIVAGTLSLVLHHDFDQMVAPLCDTHTRQVWGLVRAMEELESMDMEDRRPFTKQERRALMVLGVPWKMGTMTPQEAARFERIGKVLQ